MSFVYEIEKVDERDIVILKVKGELELPDRSEFLKALDELLAQEAAKVVIDISNIMSMSSLYIGTLVDFGARVEAGGRTAAIMAQPRVANVCEMIGLQKVMQIIRV